MHDVYRHADDGTKCIWLGDSWFVPLDAGGEGYTCTKEHFTNPKPKQTPREEFEEMFGAITDERWQWLKEFCDRNYNISSWLRGVAGYRVPGEDRTYHPDDVEIIR